MKILLRLSRMVLLTRTALQILIVSGLLLTGTAVAEGEVHVLTSSDLPITLGSNYQNDTIRISGTKITSVTNGITVDANGVVLDLGWGANRDTLEFCTDGSNGRYGIKLNDGITGTIIRGGHILMDGVDVGTDTTWNSRCILLQGNNNTLLDSVYTTTDGGFECHNILASNTGYCNNLDIIGGRHISNQFGFNSRMDYNETTIRIAIEGENIGDDYTVKITDAYITSIHGAIEISENAESLPLFEIARCSIIVDARNDIWDDRLPTDADWKGSINAQGIGFYGAAAGSSIHDNVILSDSIYWGCDVGIIFEWARGTAEDPVRIYNNTITISRGLDAYYNEENGDRSDSKGMKWRNMDAPQVNQYVYVYNNDITVLVDGDNSTDYRTIGGHCLEPQSWWGASNALDNNIRIYDNDLTAIVTSEVDRDIVIASCFRFAIDDGDMGSYYDNDNLIYGNRLKSDNIIYTMGIGCYDGGANDVRVYADTISFGDDTTNFSVFAFGNCEWEDQGGNEFIDLTYMGTCDDIYWSADSSDDAVGSFSLKRIVELYVRGSNGLPVVNATCSLLNDYGAKVISGSTDNGGLVTDTVTYEYRVIRSNASSGNDSLRASFNDFSFYAHKDVDNATNAGFTVGWTPAGGTDTLTLPNTIGTGQWREPTDPPDTSDTILPGTIMDLEVGCLPGTDSLLLAWTATGDDGSSGTATRYDIRRSTSAITTDNFYSSIAIANPPDPRSAGTAESMKITVPDINTEQYFAIRAYDEVNNPSGLAAPTFFSPISIRAPDCDTFFVDELGESVTLVARTNQTCQTANYQFQLDTLDSFSTASVTLDTDADSLASATFGDIATNKVYYWRCRAIAKDGGDTTAFTFRRAFMPIVSLAAGCTVPRLISPADEATIGTNRPSLVIENTATDDGSVFFFEVAADYDFNELIAGGVVTPESADSTVWTVDTDLPTGQTGYWRVWMNNCQCSEVFRFMIASEPEASVFTYPNPFRPAETPEVIFSGLPANSALTLISISGGTVRRWDNITSGQVSWDGHNESGNSVASGVYLWYVDNPAQQGKIVVIR